jgi:hypothetical protein
MRITAEIPIIGDWKANQQCEQILSLVAALGTRSREGVVTIVDPEEFDARTGHKPVIHFLGTVPIVGEVS